METADLVVDVVDVAGGAVVPVPSVPAKELVTSRPTPQRQHRLVTVDNYPIWINRFCDHLVLLSDPR